MQNTKKVQLNNRKNYTEAGVKENKKQPDNAVYDETAVKSVIESYMNETYNYNLLSPEQEIELAKRKDAGDKKAFDELVVHNLRLVASVAQKYRGYGMEYEDLIQEGNLGLMKAVKMFDWTKGYRFSTYAHYWIQQSIMRSIGDKSRTVRLPVHVSEKAYKIKKYQQKQMDKYGYMPSVDEAAKALDIPVQSAKNAVNAEIQVTSYNAMTGDDESTELVDFIDDKTVKSPEQYAHEKMMAHDLEKAMDKFLTEREKTVLKYRWGLETGRKLTLEEVGKIFNVTRERIRQIEAKAFKKLRDTNDRSHLKEYLAS